MQRCRGGPRVVRTTASAAHVVLGRTVDRARSYVRGGDIPPEARPEKMSPEQRGDSLRAESKRVGVTRDPCVPVYSGTVPCPTLTALYARLIAVSCVRPLY